MFKQNVLSPKQKHMLDVHFGLKVLKPNTPKPFRVQLHAVRRRKVQSLSLELNKNNKKGLFKGTLQNW